MLNTRIDFMYRDGGNNKVSGTIVLAGEMTTEEQAELAVTLDEGEFFGPVDVGIEPVWPTRYIEDVDHNSHYFHVSEMLTPARETIRIVEVELTPSEPTDSRSIKQFIRDFQRAEENGWPSFGQDPKMFRDFVASETLIDELVLFGGYDEELVTAAVAFVDEELLSAEDENRVRAILEGDASVDVHIETGVDNVDFLLQAVESALDPCDINRVVRLSVEDYDDMDEEGYLKAVVSPSASLCDALEDFREQIMQDELAVTVADRKSRLSDPKVRKRAVEACAVATGVGRRKAANLLDGSQDAGEFASSVDALRSAYNSGRTTPAAVVALLPNATAKGLNIVFEGVTLNLRNTSVAYTEDSSEMKTGLPLISNDPLSVAAALRKAVEIEQGRDHASEQALINQVLSLGIGRLIRDEIANVETAIRNSDIPVQSKATLASMYYSLIQMPDDIAALLVEGDIDEATMLLGRIAELPCGNVELENIV